MATFRFSSAPGVFYVTLEGLFNKDSAAQYVNSFLYELNKIDPPNCELYFDVTKFQLLPAEMLETLEGCFKLYQSIGFKKILINLGGNTILGMQVTRIAKRAGLENYELI